MERDKLIPAKEVCQYYNIQISFFHRLRDEGLITIIREEDSDYIEPNELSDLERMIRLHNDLDINPEGIEAINHLLEKIRQMQNELTQLRNRLRFFEEG